jgi:hypothetical protein
VVVERENQETNAKSRRRGSKNRKGENMRQARTQINKVLKETRKEDMGQNNAVNTQEYVPFSLISTLFSSNRWGSNPRNPFL